MIHSATKSHGKNIFFCDKGDVHSVLYSQLLVLGSVPYGLLKILHKEGAWYNLCERYSCSETPLKVRGFASPWEVASGIEMSSDFPCYLIDFSFCSCKNHLVRAKH